MTTTERLPGGAVRWWFWMPLAAAPVAAPTTLILDWYQHWYEGWGLVAAAMAAAALLGGLASVVLHRRTLGPGAAAGIGMAVAVASLFTFGAVFLAGRVVGESLGWHSVDEAVSGEDWVVSTLLFGVFGLLWTWWYALPFGALGGWLAWRAASHRTPRALPSPVRVD